jgi:hypothetical protein
VLEVVPCDASLPEVVAGLIDAQQRSPASKRHPQLADSLPETARPAASSRAPEET